MGRVDKLIKREVLRAEKNSFIFRLFIVFAGYIGITLWLNSIRQSAALWFVWTLIAVQLFFYLSIFVASSLRAKQCGYRYPWLWLFPILVLSRVENWELVVFPLFVVIMLILSERNQRVSDEALYLIPEEGDDVEEEEYKIRFRCQNCGVKYSASTEQIGKEGECKKCGESLIVPDMGDFDLEEDPDVDNL